MSREARDTFSRRRFLGLAAAGTAAGVIAACAPKATPSQPSEGQEQPVATSAAAPPEPATQGGTPISYWVFWTQYGDLLDQFRETEEFKEMFADMTVDMQVGVKQEVFLTNVAAGTPPDVAATSNYVNFLSRPVLLPIEDLVAQSSVVKPDMFIASNWEGCKYKGVQYGVPANEGFVRRALYYNTKMIEEAGLDPDNPPQTWPEVFAWNETLTKFDANGNVLQIGIDPYDAIGGSAGGCDGFYQADAWGFAYFDVETSKFNFDNAEFAESLEVMGEFYKFFGPDNMTALRDVEGQDTWGGSFNAEVQAMIIEGYWHCGETMHEKPEVGQYNRATWVPVPESRRGTKVQYGDGHMVLFFKDAPHPAESFKVAEFLQTKAACDIIFNTIGWLPALPAYIDTVDPSAFPGLDFVFTSVDEATYWGPIVQCEIQGFVDTKAWEVREAVYRGNMTGAQAAAEMQAACEAEYAASGYAG